jgi:hypothetical protein
LTSSRRALYFNIPQVRDVFDVSDTEVRNWIAEGTLTPVRVEGLDPRTHWFERARILSYLPRHVQIRGFRLISPQKAAELTNVTPATLAAWARDGIITAVPLPGDMTATGTPTDSRYVLEEIVAIARVPALNRFERFTLRQAAEILRMTLEDALTLVFEGELKDRLSVRERRGLVRIGDIKVPPDAVRRYLVRQLYSR